MVKIGLKRVPGNRNETLWSVIIEIDGKDCLLPELEKISSGDLQKIFKTYSKNTNKKPDIWNAFSEACSNDPVAFSDLKQLFLEDCSIKPKYVEPIKKDTSTEKQTISYDELSKMVKPVIGDANIDIYKNIMAIIVSMYYAETESLYGIVLAAAGSGKSTLLEMFESCDNVKSFDNSTMNVMASGTAVEDEEKYSLLDDAADKTLIVHDLTSFFEDDQAKLKNFKGVLENIYGRVGYRKASPGSGIHTYGKRLNLIFGVNPRAFWMTYKGTKQRIGPDLIATERYIYFKVPERDQSSDYRSGRVITKEIKEKLRDDTAKFVNNLQYTEITISKEDREMIADKIDGYFGSLGKNVFNWKKNTKTRRYMQCEQFCKSLACIDGRKKILPLDVDFYVKCLELPMYKEEVEEIEEVDEDSTTNEQPSNPSWVGEKIEDVRRNYTVGEDGKSR